MPTYVIKGGTPLYGSVRVGGAKNASYKLMIAALLGDSESRILNFSRISDVALVAKLINSLGAHSSEVGERAYTVNPSSLSSHSIDKEHGDASRASTLFLPILLSRFGEAVVPLPGGDKIGKRPLERHFDGLKALGVDLEVKDGMIWAKTKGMRGTSYRFEKNTHTGTETLILAAVKAKGLTILENAAAETEIDDLITFLNQMGAKIRRRPGRIIEIVGVGTLHGAIHQIMPDQNQVVSFAVAALATKGDIVVENANAADLHAFLQQLENTGAGYDIGDYGIRFFYKGQLKGTQVTTAIHPGFKTDWQPLWVALMTQAKGESTVHETIQQRRFQYVKSLREMGAEIEMFNPKVDNLDETYNFNVAEDSHTDFHAVKIIGPSKLAGGEFTVEDLRHGATLMIAGMAATGETTLHDPKDHIGRGYEKLDEQFNLMGAQITKI
ncbi:MAG TPA: UDP-N-acetylglucosamine 1-carboxyvinyltransferase [Patescibacteria group bacterium]|nr:UDP-N-acetylglucosamine 1-carboxyvinyltransferase [Patescibacteria group bacterium]